jgi:hypothetical protein
MQILSWDCSPDVVLPTSGNQLSNQWRSQKFAMRGAHQQKKCLAQRNRVLALYSPPGIFWPTRVLGHPGYSLGTPMSETDWYLEKKLVIKIVLYNRYKI